MKNGWDMPAKTPGDACLRKTWKKTRILLALVIFGAIVLSAAVPAKAEGTPTSVVVFTDKHVYNPFAIDLGKTGGTPIYDSDFAADFSIYVYAIVLNEKGIILKGREGLLSGTIVDQKEYKHTDPNNHIGATVNNPGIVGSKTLTFKDDGSVNGDIAGDGIYVALVDMPENIGTKLAAPTDELLVNITVTDPVAGSAYTDVLIAGFNCMNSPEFASSFNAHVNTGTITGTAFSDNCVVCHRAYEHFFENISGVIQYQYLDAHFKNATARSRVPNPQHSAVKASKDWDLSFRWNLSDYNGGGALGAKTLEAMAPGSSFCYFCHTYNLTSTTVGVLKYGNQRSDLTQIPSCNNSNCHTTTKIAGNAVPAWSPASAAAITSPSVSSPNYNITMAEKHAHDSTGRDTVPCASCHDTVHGLRIPNSTSTDYTDLAYRCLSCHQLFNKHNSSISCIKCHTNDVHNIRFLQNDTSYNWSKTNVVTCENCHSNTTFAGTLGLNPPQVPYTNHSGDLDAGQKWGDYWTSKNQQQAAGSNLIKSSPVNVSSESVVYGSTTGSPTNLSAAQTVDGVYETLTEGTKTVLPTDAYTYVQSNSSTFGTITNWANIQNASDSNANATFTEVSSGSGTNVSYFGSVADNTASVVNATNAEVYDGNYADLGGGSQYVSLSSWKGLNGGGSITSVLIFARARVISGGNDKIKLSYSLYGLAGPTSFTSAALTTTFANVSVNITADRSWTWDDLANIYANATQVTNGAADNVYVDAVWLQVTYTALNTMDITTTMSVPQADNYYLEMNYYTSGDTFNVYAYNGTAWNNKSSLTQTGTFAVFNVSLTSAEYNSGSPQIRFRDRQTGVGVGNLYIDYMRIHGWTADTSHQEIVLYHNFTGIPKYRAKETAAYTITVKGNVTAGENLDIYAYAYDANEYELVKDKAFSTTDGWVNYTIPYEAISDNGEASIQFRDSNRTRYDNVQDKFYLDYVGIKADSYKYLPCYYCHALLANHKKRALGNIENVQTGASGQNPKNSTNLTGYWCANCHYNGSTPSGTYKYNGSTWSPAPPLIAINNVQNNSASWYNHSDVVATNFTDAKCKECHGNAAIQTTKQFPHTVDIGSSGGANCTNCHNIGGSAGTGRLVNFTAMNESLAIHKNLNKGATTSDPVNYSVNKRCWACHGNGSEPGNSHPTNYKTPYKCVDCHIPNAGQNMNFTPQSILNVTQHYWNGTSIDTSGATTCYDCHNRSEMMLGLNLDLDGAAGVYSGSNGGNNSTSHYGKKRSSEYPAQGTNDYCYKCHNNASAVLVFPYSNTNNATIANHSSNYPSSNPACDSCHATQAGRIHNDTLYKPAFALPNSSYCLNCHGSGGTATIKNLERHNGTTGLNCTQCHLNTTESIHPARYLQQGGSTWDTSKANAVNCTSCHQGSGIGGSFSSAPKVPAPMNHSTNVYSGALWNNTPQAYWTNTSQQSSCNYCHGTVSFHNTSGLGNITRINGTNSVRQSLTGGYWCANCHYNGSTPSGKYNYKGSLFNPVPPEILNLTGLVPASSRSGTNFENHSSYVSSGYDDNACKSCHDNNLDAGATSLNFSHNVAIGVAGGPNCTNCHDVSGTLTNGKKVNFTAINDSLAIHRNLNSGATSPSGYPSANFKCWACHGNGQEPASGHPSSYKTPYKCVDCHVQGVNQNLNFTPNNTLLNVTQHYWNGSNISTAGVTSCYSCHNRTEMMLGSFDPDGVAGVYGGANGGNNSTSHYGKKRTDMAGWDTTTYCTYCHNTTTSNATFYVSDFNNTILNHTARATTSLCTTCHNNGRIHNSTLAKPVSNDSFCSTCHGTGGTAATNNKSEHKTLYCTECHANNTAGTLAGKDIHAIKYLTQSNTFSTTNSSAVNCVTCHQTTTVDSSLTGFTPFKIVNPLHHSDNASNGSVWDSYWTNTTPQTACIYCHNDTKHNATPLGRILQWNQNYKMYGSISTNASCADCHYKGSANYTSMNSTFASAGLRTPPEITNGTNWKGNFSNYYNHSLGTYDDQTCKSCHGSLLSGSANMSEFVHNAATGVSGGANCTACHNVGGSAGTGRLVNFSALNDTNAIHKNLNSGATTSLPAENKKCWACHGNGEEPSGHPTRYKTPYNCVDCHVQGAGQNFNYIPNNTILNVTQHYWNGSNISTANVTSCYSCHNRSEMMVGLNLDPDGAASVYGGANGGNNSSSHYGKKRSDMAVLDNTTYCNYCHNNQSSVFPFVNSSNKTIFNHSMNYPATNPACRECHEGGRIHNSTLYKPVFNQSNSTYCLNCHGSNGTGGTNYTGAVTGYKEKHNNSICTQCHLNSTQSIHPVRYIQQDSTWSTSNITAVNCTTCHQGSGMGGFGSAPLVQTPIWHSNNSYSGALWNGNLPRFWDNTSQQSSCDYCHGKEALHNTSALGKSFVVQGNNSKNQSLTGGYWCANCHYNGSSSSGNYSYKGNLLSPVPPEIFNLTGLVPANSSDDTPFQNHSVNVAGDWSDNRCKQCHGKDLPAGITSATFMHKLNKSKPDAGGPDCLKCHPSTANEPDGPPADRRINKSAFTNYSVHMDLNKNATNTTALSDNRSKACWACHGDGAQPVKHPANYLAPKQCEYCHVNNNFNAPQVYKHYPGAAFSVNMIYDNLDPTRTCIACHNNSQVNNLNLTYGSYDATKLKNATLAHYAVNRTVGENNPNAVTDILPDTRNTTGSFGCIKCHSTGIEGYPAKYGNARIIPTTHNFMGSSGVSCQASCHNSDPSVNVTLHDTKVGMYIGSGCYSTGCHQSSSGGRRRR